MDEHNMNNCWNTIGVWGTQKQKCERLSEVIHCRNCEIYTAAGRQAFEKRIPAEYLEQRTLSYAQIESKAAKEQLSVLIFRVATQWFCLPTEYCNSIEPLSSIHNLPRYSNETLLGIVNVKGDLHLCFSIANLLQVQKEPVVEEVTKTKRNSVVVYRRLLVMCYEGWYFVLPVDEVGGIKRINPDKTEKSATAFNNLQSAVIAGMIKDETGHLVLLDAPCLFAALEDSISG
jgi:chemotaxis-related protein WspD